MIVIPATLVDMVELRIDPLKSLRRIGLPGVPEYSLNILIWVIEYGKGMSICLSVKYVGSGIRTFVLKCKKKGVRFLHVPNPL